MYKCFSSGLLGSNTYVVFGEGNECMIVDVGNPVAEILKFIREKGLSVGYIVLTHAHYDHADYLSEYKTAFPDAILVAHESEVKVMTDCEANVSMYFGMPKSYGYPDKTVRDGDVISVCGTEYRVLHTPGHTPGSICLYSAADKLMLTGDTLFQCGRGRCDFKYGSEVDMAASLRRLFEMDSDITFLSGHGMPSTLGEECGRVF